MKKLSRAAPAILLALVIACAANRAAYTTIGATKITVDTGMKAWAAYVAQTGRCIPAAPAPGCIERAKEVQISQALKDYKQTAATLGAVLEATNEMPTPKQLADAAKSLIALVERFTGKKVVTP